MVSIITILLDFFFVSFYALIMTVVATLLIELIKLVSPQFIEKHITNDRTKWIGPVIYFYCIFSWIYEMATKIE